MTNLIKTSFANFIENFLLFANREVSRKDLDDSFKNILTVMADAGDARAIAAPHLEDNNGEFETLGKIIDTFETINRHFDSFAAGRITEADYMDAVADFAESVEWITDVLERENGWPVST